MNDSGEREHAARLLIRVEGGAFASRLLADDARPGVRSRVLGVLRRQRALDAVLAEFSVRPLNRLDPEVRTVLRLGLFEARGLSVPPPVAVDGAVGLIRRLRKASAAGLVNAVLRRAVVEYARVLDGRPEDVQLSFPRWLARRWRHQLGVTAARDAMAVCLEPAPAWGWLRDPGDPVGTSLRGHPWCPGAIGGDDSSRLVAMARAGRAYIQDPASQLVAEVAGGLLAASEGRFVDLCAAPGGKAFRLCTRLERVNGLFVDRSLMRSRLARSASVAAVAAHGEVGGGDGPAAIWQDQLAGPVVADGRLPPLAPASVDLALVDAPCSGTGTLRRHPELKWRLTPNDLSERARLQRGLIDAAAPLVRPGGWLLYATCSLEPEENEAHFEELPPGFVAVDLAAELPPAAPRLAAGSRGTRIPPGDDWDGFTLHLLRRG